MNANTNFFSTCKTQAEAKAQYQRLASRYHPDKNAKDKAEYTAIMQEINRQYQQFTPPQPTAPSGEAPKVPLEALRNDMHNWYLIERFINEQVYTCQTHLVEALFEKGVFEWEEITNSKRYAEICDANGRSIELTETEINEYREEVEMLLNDLYDLEIDLSDSKEPDGQTLTATINNPNPLFDEPTPLSMAITTLERVLEDIDDAELEEREILEWWLITPLFARELDLYDEPLLKNEFGTWWGRTTSGQSLSCENFIWVIAFEKGVFQKERAA